MGPLRAIGGAVARLPRALADGIRGFWWSLGDQGRRRLVAAVAAALVVGLFFALAVPRLPCELPAGDSCPPPDDAEELVPADALAYVHANVDPGTDQFEQAVEISRSLPTIGNQIASRAVDALPIPGRVSSFEREIEPWFGGEAALVVIPGPGPRAQQVALLEVEDRGRAAKFARDTMAGKPRTARHEGIEVSTDRDGSATAQVEDFLAFGRRAGINAVIDTATGVEASPALADDEVADEVRDRLPDHRLAEAYVSAEGAVELLDGAQGVLGTLEPFVAARITRGAAVAVAANDGELELAVRSLLDPERGRRHPGFFAAFARFEPELPDQLGSDSLAYVGIGDPERTVEALLKQASADRPGIASGFEDLARELRRDGALDLERELLPALGAEAAFAVAPRPVQERDDDEADATIPPPPPAPGELLPEAPPAEQATPYLEFVARDVDVARARRALAQLQRPVVKGIAPTAGLQAPAFESIEVGGVEAQTLRVSPTIELTYAVFDQLAAVATDPAGIEQLADGDDELAEDDLYERVTEDFADELSLLAFFDLGELVSAGEQLGLAEDPVYITFAPEIRTLRALGLSVRAGEDSVAADARLAVDSPPDDDSEDGEASPEPEAPTP